MKIEVNISKRYAFMILGAILLVGGIFFAYAYGGNNPPVMGHSPGEIAPGKFGGISADDASSWEFPGEVNVTRGLCFPGVTGGDWPDKCIRSSYQRQLLESTLNYRTAYAIDLTGSSGLIDERPLGPANSLFCALQHVQIWGDLSGTNQNTGCQIYAPNGLSGDLRLKAYRGNTNEKVYCAVNCMFVVPPAIYN